jgi:hypothetical protein
MIVGMNIIPLEVTLLLSHLISFHQQLQHGGHANTQYNVLKCCEVIGLQEISNFYFEILFVKQHSLAISTYIQISV